MSKGGIIGVDNTPTTSVASGVWGLMEAYKYIEDGTWPGLISYGVGLTSSLLTTSGNIVTVWTSKEIDITEYAGATARLVVKYDQGSTYTSDVQIMDIVLGDTVIDFASDAESFQTTTSDTASYSGASWTNVGTGKVNTRWNRDNTATTSGNTGILPPSSAYCVYFEGSSVFNTVAWLRSSEIVLDSTPLLTFDEARYGTECGPLNYYLEITALP